jgi:outer membrane protein assembly factor BamB
VQAPGDAKVEWSLPAPPLPPTAPKGANPPPALNGELKDGTLTLGKLPRQAGVVMAKAGNLVARARVRVAAVPPYKEDFEKISAGGVPGGWVNVQSKYTVVELNGSKVLSKVNTDSRPPIARANAYITSPWASDYTIEADVMGTEVRGRFPDMGLCNSRYTLILDGKQDAGGKRMARLVTWEARPRLGAATEFDWQPDVWYHLKLTVTSNEKSGHVRAKVWKKGDAEPAEWTVAMEDPSPNREGAAAVYAYISDPTINEKNPGSHVYFDNVTITPNAKK